MTVSLDDVKKLREATGASMMACKKALEETDGEYEKAVDILRKKEKLKLQRNLPGPQVRELFLLIYIQTRRSEQ